MEGIRGGRWGEDAAGEDFRRSRDEAEVEGESEDGNLIEGQGIFLGKEDNGRSNKVEMSTPVPHGFGS
jgi:hypothetical protein